MPERRLHNALHKLLGDRIAWGFSTANLTTLGVGGPAWGLARPENEGELAAVVAECRAEEWPYMVIGCGSNLLFPDAGYRGLLIKLRPGFEKFELDGNGILRAGAGAKVSAIVSAGLSCGFSGMECLSGIPCSMGGALIMNAGSGGGAVSDCLTRLDYMDSAGQVFRIGKANLNIEYRRLGGIPQGGIILGAEFQLLPTPPLAIKARLDEMTAQRRKSQPQGVRSAGCFFKNPAGESAGRLIDQCGLKGFQIGGARVSEAHANFFVNMGKATAADFLQLMNAVIEKVHKERGLILEPEVHIVGSGNAN